MRILSIRDGNHHKHVNVSKNQNFLEIVTHKKIPHDVAKLLKPYIVSFSEILGPLSQFLTEPYHTVRKNVGRKHDCSLKNGRYQQIKITASKTIHFRAILSK